MVAYLIRRILLMIPTIFAISLVAFLIIQLPPGDFLDGMVSAMEADGNPMRAEMIAALRERYGLDQPVFVQYWQWITGIVLRGDFGMSFEWRQPVQDLIWERTGLTFLLSLLTLVFVWIVSFPIGVYSAVRRYSVGDYVATFLGFIGLAIPNFLLALVLLFGAYKIFGVNLAGLFSREYENAPWSMGKVLDLMAHLWLPLIVLGSSGIASLFRIMRANLLDELYKPYVVTARAKGLPEWKLILKYPVRVALNPFVSTVGWVLPDLVSGAVITAVVLNLPLTGPMLLRALQSQDMYLAGSFILVLGVLTVIGTLISDILLAMLDPRIRYR
ncbi:ABC transporter permease [Devosia geojensis]|uniref:ABC transporter permease n=1 Tax=Devosia geojensis TaxID=443610 RepID=A0A0F5FSI4_9HYPH|nr:ABC transporter permease [Devosia geojensis]KKB11836.1 ABC transporter permease [Devosia geojensis]